ncbi:shikimate kinase [Ruminococcus sp.]|uniref:shikimate kinase n=1 Tax=Ruminococcus sp. TaxID=41978 RepID=UPI0025E2B6C6|nr:shikimate kinase [Ruminococcus sp.]MCR4638090.1 shikimate kinase [Ruminococcus sp.]
MNGKNIILIGMPAVGKSTVGVILAKLLGYSFVDTDLLIQEREGKLLKNIIAEKGIDGFIETENRILSRLDAENSVISTGGSVIYGDEAMKNLSRNGTVIYLKLDYNKLKYRLHNIKNRGVVIREGQSLSSLYRERTPLYERYADIIIDENGCNIEKTVVRIMESLKNPL